MKCKICGCSEAGGSMSGQASKRREIPGQPEAIRAAKIIQEHSNQLPAGSDGRFYLAYAIGVIKGGFLISDSDLADSNSLQTKSK